MINCMHIFTDGSSRGNPGPGGWGFVIVINNNPNGAFEGDYILNYGRGFKIRTTNNAMELEGIKQAILTIVSSIDKKATTYVGTDRFIIHSDSSYCINIFTKWIYNWRRKGLLETKKNWQSIDTIDVYRKRIKKPIDFNKISGHSGNLFNELADKLATGTLKEIPFGFDIYETDYYKLEQWK